MSLRLAKRKRKGYSVRMNTPSREQGAVNPLVISNVLVGLVAIVLAGISVWAFVNYQDQKNNVDSKIETAVAAAKKEQADADEKEFIEREKEPTRDFIGPDDLGRVTFKYPKTWSVYVGKTGSNYEAYLNPGVVPTVSNSQPFAVRVVIEDKTYDTILRSYESRVEKKELTSAPFTVGEFSGIRLDGEFTDSRKGTAVIFKVRDKTLTIATDAEAFKGDFDTIVLPSLSFNP